MILLIFFAFLAGIVTILSPCILPILPIVLSGSVAGDKKRPLGIIAGFIASFTFFTLFLTIIINATGIPVDTLRYIAAIVLLFFGVGLLLPAFQNFLERLFTKASSLAPNASSHTGFFGGIIIGLTAGLIWSPCVGPILASVIALAATSKVTSTTFLITLAYAIGSAIPMFLVMHGGRKLLNRVPWLLKNAGGIQKCFGILMIILAFMIFFGLDRNFESFIASTPYGANLTKLEENSAVKNQLGILKGQKTTDETSPDSSLFNANSPAPDFVGINKWLDPDQPLTIADLKGKVVLVDFWTYTCINCIRTLPFVTSWYDKYHDKGFVVVGVHTPEFAFEHDTGNVENAIKMYNIHYPVAQDNDYATWNAYQNQYWPAEYLIDGKGIIRRTHFGEGEYDQMEEAIQTLLKENGATVAGNLVNMKDQTPTGQLSPETYVGSKRMQFYYPDQTLPNGTQTFTLNQNATQNSFSLGGTWTINDEYSMTGSGATLLYNFLADKVYLVMRPGQGNSKATVKVLLDGKPVDTSHAGNDVKDGIVTVDQDRLYNLIDLKGQSGNHKLQLEFQTPNTEVFAFTFG